MREEVHRRMGIDKAFQKMFRDMKKKHEFAFVEFVKRLKNVFKIFFNVMLKVF